MVGRPKARAGLVRRRYADQVRILYTERRSEQRKVDALRQQWIGVEQIRILATGETRIAGMRRGPGVAKAGPDQRRIGCMRGIRWVIGRTVEIARVDHRDSR